MNLLDYVKAERGRGAALAGALGVAPELVSQWANDARRVPAERCPAIERATRAVAAEKGDPSLIVRCEDLRPDVAWGVLREQIGTEGAPPVPAEARDAA